VWKDGDPVQVVKNLHLPRFTLEKFLTDSCNSKTNTGNNRFIHVRFYIRKPGNGRQFQRLVNNRPGELQNSELVSQQRMASSGMLLHVAVVRTDVSEELSASFISVKSIGELGTTLAITSKRHTLRRNTK
jgi:hypothetical protein